VLSQGLVKDHAVAVFYDLTTRSSTKPSHTTSMDSTSTATRVIVCGPRLEGSIQQQQVPTGDARSVFEIRAPWGSFGSP
jgi:hypothetical protein